MLRLFFIFELNIFRMECLKNIVGIAKEQRECVSDLNTDVSDSGLYLEDLEGGLDFRALDNVDVYRKATLMAENARETAIKKFEADILAGLSLKFKNNKKPYNGFIGKQSYNTSLKTSKPKQFLRIEPKANTTAVLEIQNIKLVLDADALNVHVEIIDENGNIYLSEIIDAVKNTFVSVPLSNPLILDLDKTYFVTWEKTGNVNPRNVKISCGCSGENFDSFVNVRGGESESDLSNPRFDQYTHGFSLSVRLYCETKSIICKEYDSNDAVALVTAWAILYKMGEILNESILNSGEVNRYTMMNREYLWGKRNHFRKEYEDRINYLSDVIDLSDSTCFICVGRRMIKTGIIS